MNDEHRELRVDVVVIGGGIAGLWVLAHLRARGYSALLCEGGDLGAGQTIAAQGIIHGGIKYALAGTRPGALPDASRELAAMPSHWLACLRGERDPDLRAAQLQSPHHYLFTDRRLGTRMTAFLASKSLRAQVTPVAAADLPELLARGGSRFGGAAYRVDEPVVDVRSVLAALRGHNLPALLAVDPAGTHLVERDGVLVGVDVVARAPSGQKLRLLCQRLVLTAGVGNETLCRGLSRPPAMQRRPLRMVLVRGKGVQHRDGLPSFYGHCVATASDKPRFTLVSFVDAQGRSGWYLGGQLSESGADRDSVAQLDAARAELAAVLPWINLDACEMTTLALDRAEGQQASGGRPAGPVVVDDGAVTVVWPTKLAFAPRVAEQVEERLRHAGVRPQSSPDGTTEALHSWPRPRLAACPWDEEARWQS